MKSHKDKSVESYRESIEQSTDTTASEMAQLQKLIFRSSAGADINSSYVICKAFT